MHNATQSNTTIITHCTTSTELLLSGTDDSSVTQRTSFKLQQRCHYFVSNPCTRLMYTIHIWSATCTSFIYQQNTLIWNTSIRIQTNK